MGKAIAFDTAYRYRKPTLLTSDVAAQQWGVIGCHQLRACGVSANMVRRWRVAGTLHLLHPEVYALGHPSIPIEGRLVAALLHAGQDAVLSHVTAAWWWGLVADEPKAIEVSTKASTRSCRGVLVHHPRDLNATRHRRFPITTVPQTLLDYAATATLPEVRRALAKADYRRLLDSGAVRRVLGQGRAGTAKLREAVKRHEPGLARTRSWLEDVFIPLCESAGIPLPEINVRLHGWTVDALWRQERLVVELDGYDNHSTRGQMERDRCEELELRAAGFLVIRYTSQQVTEQAEQVAADLHARLEERRAQLSSTALSALAGSR
jgi:hypothetical protein